jgi:uncharacterized protein (TIGR02996 family)
MTLRPFGNVMPIHLDVLALAGYERVSRERQLRRAGTDAARKAAMRKGRRALCRRTGRDFGYDLAAWRDFLMADEDSGYAHPYAFAGVDRAVQQATKDARQRRVAAELENEDSSLPLAELRGLLAGVHESPDDDGPRLVLADWLEEHGEKDRAELIRVQCALVAADPTTPALRELRSREKKASRRSGRAWRELNDVYCRFERGLPVLGRDPNDYDGSWCGDAGAFGAAAPRTLAAGWPGMVWLDVRGEGDLFFLERPPWAETPSPLGLVARDLGEELLLRVTKLKPVRALYLCGETTLTERAARRLGKMPRLDWVGIWSNLFTPDDVTLVRHVKGLTTLDLYDREMDGECLPALRRLKSLRRLWLKSNLFEDDEAEALAGLTGLTHLDLENNSVSDAGLAALATLPRLQWLSVYGNDITDDGLPALTKCTTLRYLCVGETQVTNRGAARLRKAMPRLVVEFG